MPLKEQLPSYHVSALSFCIIILICQQTIHYYYNVLEGFLFRRLMHAQRALILLVQKKDSTATVHKHANCSQFQLAMSR